MWSDGVVDVEKVEDTNGVQLRVHRYQKHDLADFPIPEERLHRIRRSVGGG
jgi:hypothetical protein